ncbi:MAG: flagellar biosynthesis protein FlhA [Clostridia bacterium]|nr:flagellar biosynthesis protein FlhA [Clostridia bacterium]
MKLKDAVIAIVVIGIVMLIIIPLPTALVDVLLIFNISASLLVLLKTLYIKEPLEFSTFPPLLLLMTLFRLALNLSTTRLILGNNGDAGGVITTFGNFVIGGNIVVGIIIFIIIVVVQFVVITKGAERVAEVSARFTLDAMPGKQMAIDADLNAGLIDDQGAKERRLKVQNEADFYGAMDGSSKFVKGDAIVGILITLVNIVGGLIIGAISGGESFSDIAQRIALATVGDGLVSQIPALLVSVATGIIVTRANSDEHLGMDLSKQLTAQPHIFYILAGLLLCFALMPGMPKIPIFVLSIFFIGLGFVMARATEEALEGPVTTEEIAEEEAKEMRKPEKVTSLLNVDLIGVELGYGIVPLVDASQGGDLLERVVMIRRQCALDLGVIVPVIRLRDNIQLGVNQYVIKIKGVEVAGGEVMMDHFLALSTGDVAGELDGVETIEPTFGLPAKWIPESMREKADLLGYTTIDPPSVIATHMTEVIKRHSHELLNRQQVQVLMDNLKATQPALVDEVLPKVFSLGEIQKVLYNLLKENISIRDMATIIETMADHGATVRDLDLITEYVRQSLARSISKRFIPDDKARVITLDPRVEQTIVDRIRQGEQGSYVALDSDQIHGIFTSLKECTDKMIATGITPIVLTSPLVRKHFKKITEQLIPELIVLSYNELNKDIQIISDGVVTL